MSLLICFIGFQIFPGWLHFGSHFQKHLRHFGRRNLIKVKLKAKLQKGKIPSTFSSLVEGLIVAW